MSNSSWKQYGGIQKTDRFQNLGIGTLVADQILLKQKNTTNFNVNGTLNIAGGDINILGGGNAYFNNDLYVNHNSYLYNYLYFKTATPDKSNTYGYLYGDSTAGTFGINGTNYGGAVVVTNPNSSSTFDILSNKSTVFSARTTAASINNIIAQQGTTNNSVNALADSTSSTIKFIVGSTNSSTISSTGSQLTLTSNNIQLNTTYTYITSASGSTYQTTTGSTMISTLSGNMIMNTPSGNNTITSNGTTTFDASNGIISKSKMTISNRSTYSNINGELVTIYDISTNPYLYDYYENTIANSGNALTLVSSDSSSSTFCNILTPLKNGFSIGGGTFINDFTRSMGTFGITTLSGNFIPSQTIISGNSTIKYLTTTGINTYNPKSETYVMDINGPTRIGNGEVNTMLRMNYEILDMKFSKRSFGYGIIVGSPSSTTNPYTQTISYTSNGGKTWSQTNIGVNNIDTRVQSLNTYIYNQNYAFVSSSSTNNGVGLNILYYTSNGGANWSQISDASSSTVHKTFSSIYVYDTSIGNHKILIGGNNTDANKNQLFSYVATSSFTFPGSINYGAVDVSLTTINDSDGSANFMYLVGNGIQKFDVSGSNPVPLYYTNSGITYNSIYTYDSSYAIAVGTNNISYTTNATTWQNATVSNINGGSFNMMSVYIYDLSNALAVGDSGVIAYTINGSQTWQTVPSTILNSAGTGSRITNSNNNLRGVFMPDINSFVISDVSTSFVLNGPLAKSKIIYGFYPNIFNRINNKVLDVSGNMETTGDLLISGSGQLKSNNSTFNLLNDTVSTINLGGATSQVNIGGSSTSVSTPGTLNVTKDVSFNNRLFISNDLFLNGTAQIRSTNTIGNIYNDTVSTINLGGATSQVNIGGSSTSVSTPGTLNVTKDVSFNNRLFISNDLFLNGTAQLRSTNTIGNIYNDTVSTINLGGATTQLNIGGSSTSVSIPNTLSVTGNSSLSTVNTTGTLYSPLYDSPNNIINIGSSSSNKTINISSMSLGSNTTIYIGKPGDTVFLRGNVFNTTQQALVVNSYIIQINEGSNSNNSSRGAGIQIRDNSNDLAGYLLVSNDMASYNFKAPNSNNVLRFDMSGLVVNGATNPMVVLRNSASLYNDSSFDIITNNNIDADYNGNFYVAIPSILNGDASLNSNLKVGGNTVLNSNLYVNNDASLNGNLYVVSKTTLNNDVFMNSRLFVGNDVSMNSRLFVGNDVSMNSRLFVGNDVSMNSRLFVGKDVSMNSRLFVGNDVSMNSRLFVGNDVSMNSRLFVGNDVSMNSRLFVGNDVSMNSRLFVGNDVSMNSRLFVGNDVSMNSRLFVGNDVSMNSRLFVGNDVSMNGGLYVVSKTTLNNDVSINANITINKTAFFNSNIAINKTTVAQNTVLDISGNMNQIGGVVFQF